MAASQSQVEGLRKAYAEIILNMAKESAARVLAAERRAAVLAGRVAAVKEDGVAALIRLKAVMEARIKEVESQSLAHVRKINELQEQLSGAQNTVAYLQVDLQTANTELEQTRKTLAEERTNILPTSDKIDSNKNRNSRSKMHLQNRSVSLKNKNTTDDICRVPTNSKGNGAVENVENVYHCGSDLASFMSRNKKPELYRNGCTQRIRALKQQTPSADSSLEQNSKQATALNSCSKIGKNDTSKNLWHTRSIMEQILQTKFLANCKRKRGRRSRPSYKHDSSGEHGRTEDKSSYKSDENGCLLLLQALEQDLSPPNMLNVQSAEGLTDLKDDLLMGGKDADLNLCTASPRPIDAHAVSNMQMIRRKRSKTVRVFEAGCSESRSVPVSGSTLLRSTNENIILDSAQSSERIDNCSDTPPINSSSVLSDGTENLVRPSDATENLMHPSDATENLMHPSDATENLMHPSDATENLMHPSDATENLMHPSDANTGQFKSGNSSPVILLSTKSQIGGELRVDHQECRTSENNSAGWKEVKVDESCNLSSDTADALTVSSLGKEQNAKASSGVCVQAEGARYIKYTFNRRKRKSASLDSTPQGAVPEKSSSLVSLAVKQEPQAKPETQDLLVESPRGDNQLVHVAQQLILLSELKW